MYIDIYSSIIRDTFTISFIFPGVTQHQGQADQGQADQGQADQGQADQGQSVGPSTTFGRLRSG